MSKFRELTDIFIGMRDDLARSILKIVPPDTVEDIVQETYVKLCQQGDGKDIRYPRAYFYRAVKNLALDHVLRFDQRFTDSLESATNLPAGHDQTFTDAVTHEQFGHLCDAVRRLPLQCRRVFVLKKVYNYSQKEIAAELGISEKTVEKHVALGLARCRDYMERYQPEQESRSHGKQRGEEA
ncbi:MAG: sigma-70 family RNA polymerase sigma factor [Pseudomonadota bacterium]